MSRICPICSSRAKFEPTTSDGDAIDCTRCGKFAISRTAQAMLTSEDEIPEAQLAALSHQIWTEYAAGREMCVTGDHVDAMRAFNLKLPTPSEVSANIIRAIGEFVKLNGVSMPNLHSWFCAQVGAANSDRAANLVGKLIKQGVLDGEESHTFDALDYKDLDLTLTGWREYERINTPSHTGKVFMGYRRSDTADAAGRIFDFLEMKFGRQRVFKDVDSIAVGVDFRSEVSRVIQNCDAFLVLIGPTWLSACDGAGSRRIDDPADLVRVEVEIALSSGVPVIPVLVSGASMPSDAQLPESLRRLTSLNAARVRQDPDFRNDMDRLARALMQKAA